MRLTRGWSSSTSWAADFCTTWCASWWGRSSTWRGDGSQRRDVLGMTAPAAGLCLEHIDHAIPMGEAWPQPCCYFAEPLLSAR
jgi:hypothetical protein